MRALLFDLDGTLVNTDRLHEEAWRQSLQPFGLECDHPFYQQRISGRLNPDIVADLLPQLSPAQALAFADHKEALFRKLASDLQPVQGLQTLWDWSQQHQLLLALVSNAPRANALHVLQALGLHFDTVVLSEDLAAGKPHPLPYQTALQRLGVPAHQALAFEDSPSGIHSATAAHIATVGLSTGHPATHLQEAGAFLVVPHFAHPNLWGYLQQQLGRDQALPS